VTSLNELLMASGGKTLQMWKPEASTK